MPAFDLGEINGDPWGASQLDAVELGITDRGLEIATTSQRNTIAGARLFDGKLVYDTTLHELVHYQTGDTTWHGVRPHAFYASPGATSSASNSAVTLYTGTLPTYGVGGSWQVRYMTMLTGTGGTNVSGITEIIMSLGGSEVARYRFATNALQGGYSATMTGAVIVASGGSTVAVSITRVTASPADTTVATPNDFRYNRVDAEWIPG